MQPGDLVVCVNTGVIPGCLNIDLHRLTKGDVYTIDEVFTAPSDPYGFGVTLIEVNIRDWCGWHPARFRPCRRTDISAITAGVKEREMVE